MTLTFEEWYHEVSKNWMCDEPEVSASKDLAKAAYEAGRQSVIIDDTPNRAIVQIPGRNYPAIAVQGDTLRGLCILSRSQDVAEREELKQQLASLEKAIIPQVAAG